MNNYHYTNGLLLLKRGIHSLRANPESRTNLNKEMVQQIEHEAQKLLHEQIPTLDMDTFDLFKKTGSRQQYEQLYFARRKRLTALALMVIIQPCEERYVKGLQNIIEAICEEFTWCLPAHYDDARSIDLFAAETAFTLAELSELIGERLPESLRQRMRQEVLHRVLEPFLAEESIWWEKAEHNWASVCAGSIGAAAIYYLKDEQEKLEAILQRSEQAMIHYLDGFDDDGACKEGYSYWQYGFGYFIYFMDLLRAYRNGQSRLLATEKVKQIALFQQKCFLSGKSVVNFSDSLPQVGVYMGLTQYLHAQYKEVHIPEENAAASFHEDHCGRWAPAVRNLLWTMEDNGAPWRNETYIMKQAQWLVSRAERAGSSFAFAAKGGHNAEPHNHNDLGHFILAVDGHSLLVDAGSGLYTRDYFGEKRYEYICASSAGHSVPIIDGELQQPGSHSRAVLLQCETSDDVDSMTLDLREAYASKHLSGFTRKFQWEKTRGRLVLHDEFLSNSQSMSVIERFIVAHKPETLNPNQLIISHQSASVIISFDSAELAYETEAFEYIDHFGKPTVLYRLDFLPTASLTSKTLTFTFELRRESDSTFQ